MAAVNASLGGVVVLFAALLLSSYQSQPTLIDRAFPLLALSLWILALRTRAHTLREPLLALIPITFAVQAAIPDDDLRLLILGATVAVAATLHLGSAREDWSPYELLTSLAVVVPVRLVVPGWETVLVQATLVIGAVALWRELRRGGTSLVYTAAAVLLLVVTLPDHSFRVALVPWLVLILVIALRRSSWLLKAVAVGVAVTVLKWLAAAFALIIVMTWIVGRLPRTGSPAFLPGFQATGMNFSAAIASPPFFPSLYRSPASGAVVVAAVALGMLVRPSLTSPIIAVGIVAACALRVEAGERTEAGIRLLDLPALVLTGTILLFLAWSGAIVARPPAPLPLIAVLTIAAVALLPSSVRRWSGIAAAALFAAFLLADQSSPDQSREISSTLAAGEQITIPLEPDTREAELRIAGANLGDARPGYPVAKLEVLDAAGRGYTRPISIGEIADWGAFRPSHVLATQNLRPDGLAVIEGYGAGAWVRGTGRIVIPSAADIRWVVVTGSSELKGEESVIIEELRFR